MKTRSCFMICCIVPDNNIIVIQLLDALKKITTKHFLNAQIILKTNENYWKFLECKKIIFHLTNDFIIQVSEFTNLFNISWISFEGIAHNVETKKKYYEQSFIWNKINYSEEMFLIPEVEWVHIYTWLD